MRLTVQDKGKSEKLRFSVSQFEKLTCTGNNASLAQEILRTKRPTQHSLGGCAHPAVQHRGVDGAEIDGIFQVAVLVQAAQAGWLTVNALVDRIPPNQLRICNSIILPPLPVL